MAGSSFGTLFRMTTWGETHGKGVGVVVDGCPAGLSLCEEDIQKYLNRRKPGQSKYTTKRKEDDQVEILSGVFEGKTTGTPISMAVFNKDQHSKDYSAIKDVYRPGHADYTFDKKYGFRDYRGGGRSSGRETTARVAAGAVAAKVLKELAANESFICIGRAADYILKDNPNLITIFICAPMDKCIKREMELLSFDAKKAEQHIITTDKYRAGFYKYHTGREWKNPENYDLCLNTGKFDYETCVDIIENYIKTRLAGNN